MQHPIYALDSATFCEWLFAFDDINLAKAFFAPGRHPAAARAMADAWTGDDADLLWLAAANATLDAEWKVSL